MKDQIGFPKIIGFLRQHNVAPQCSIFFGLGTSFDSIFKKYGRMKLKDILQIGLQLANRLFVLHRAGFVYKKISLSTIYFGHVINKEDYLVYISDFSLSSQVMYSFRVANEILYD